jgi:hypothetical protein
LESVPLGKTGPLGDGSGVPSEGLGSGLPVVVGSVPPLTGGVVVGLVGGFVGSDPPSVLPVPVGSSLPVAVG